MSSLSPHQNPDSSTEVPLENRKFTLVQNREGEEGAPQVRLENASAAEVLSYLDSHCVVDPDRFNPSELLETAGIYIPHAEGGRGAHGEVRICNNPAIGLQRTI